MGEESNRRTRGIARERRGFGDNYLRGLHASARENVSAYGYSVTITASFGLLSVTEGSPDVSAIFLFAAGAILAVALVEAIASGVSGIASRRRQAT